MLKERKGREEKKSRQHVSRKKRNRKGDKKDKTTQEIKRKE